MTSVRNNKTLSYAIFYYGLYLPVSDFAHKEDAHVSKDFAHKKTYLPSSGFTLSWPLLL